MIFLAMIQLGYQFYHRSFKLLQSIAPKEPLQRCHSLSPELAQRSKELGGLLDYELHFPARDKLFTQRSDTLTYVLLTPHALLVVHLPAGSFALQELQEFRFEDGISQAKADKRDAWQIKGPAGVLFTMQCRGPRGQRLADALQYMQLDIHPQISRVAQWLPGSPGIAGGIGDGARSLTDT